MSKPPIEQPEHPEWREFYDVCEVCGKAYEMYHLERWSSLVPEKYKGLSLCRECLKKHAPLAYKRLRWSGR